MTPVTRACHDDRLEVRDRCLSRASKRSVSHALERKEKTCPHFDDSIHKTLQVCLHHQALVFVQPIAQPLKSVDELLFQLGI